MSAVIAGLLLAGLVLLARRRRRRLLRGATLDGAGPAGLLESYSLVWQRDPLSGSRDRQGF